ncbi:hypothetical protein PkoCFBP13504_07700 [Pseudomonas koreensis]|nr:hypothetical protein PkoCFBP13504_07700 [Pseudomonas koreensis]
MARAAAHAFRFALDRLTSSRAGSLPQGNAFQNVGASLLAKLFKRTPRLCRLSAPSVAHA